MLPLYLLELLGVLQHRHDLPLVAHDLLVGHQPLEVRGAEGGHPVHGEPGEGPLEGRPLPVDERPAQARLEHRPGHALEVTVVVPGAVARRAHPVHLGAMGMVC